MMHPGKENIDLVMENKSYSSLISPSIAQELIESSKFKKVKQNVIHEFINEAHVSTSNVQKVIDDSDISRMGYTQIFKEVKSILKDKKISSSKLPIPARIKKSRRMLNLKVADFLGPPLHNAGDFFANKRVVHFNKFNNIFFDLENLQQKMFHFYQITPEEAGRKLIFVIKLDECERLKHKKTERMTITLIKRALTKLFSRNTNGSPNDEKERDFSVQSENHIWWLGLFEVDKEDHDILYWAFHQTQIPTIIQKQTEGELLHVKDVGSFSDEWHMII
ncbi:hypothetical protein GOP47_0023971 [Adiantum capillus-veneris]|uniref:Uncharacterized protein n=1 Tax=Adiantum capillus-veneris TaxID=13818 RepID=A0A9D4Z6G2_ADICA|nr:hypothetical protein GOP47_0023971 [Adiantum capillus-veneris]